MIIKGDNVNDPKIKKWLGEVVGKEGGDLSRHDKWLCMMYPRLKLLQRLLADDGAIFISIDGNEVYTLKLICDEIFGSSHFIGNVIWRSSDNSNNDSKKFSTDHNYTLVYAKRSDWQPKNRTWLSRKNSAVQKGGDMLILRFKLTSCDKIEQYLQMHHFSSKIHSELCQG